MVLIALLFKRMPVVPKPRKWIHLCQCAGLFLPLRVHRNSQREILYSIVMLKNFEKYVKQSSIFSKVLARGLQRYYKKTFLHKLFSRFLTTKCRTAIMQKNLSQNISICKAHLHGCFYIEVCTKQSLFLRFHIYTDFHLITVDALSNL